MCYTVHTFHGLCSHWGRDRLQPCCRSRVVDGSHTGCGYIDSLGATNSPDWCGACKVRRQQNGKWQPFAQLSDEGWAWVRLKVQKRAVDSEDYPFLDSLLSIQREKDYRTR